MNLYIKSISIGLGLLTLSSCSSDLNTMYSMPERYTYSIGPNPNYNYYPNTYRVSAYTYDNPSPRVVTVPESYHVGQAQNPVASKDLDRTWVNGQNAEGYTIEIADGDKASQVAQSLMKAPKNERMAQVKYQKEGKSYYKGLYGSFENQQAAQKALDSLPAELKQGAGVKSWGSVRGVVGE